MIESNIYIPIKVLPIDLAEETMIMLKIIFRSFILDKNTKLFNIRLLVLQDPQVQEIILYALPIIVIILI